MKTLNRREQILGILTLGVVVIGLLWSQVARPTWDQLVSANEEVYGLEKSIVRDEIRERRLARLETERLVLDDSLRPPEGEAMIPWFIAHLRALGQDAKFTPSSLRYLRASPLGAPVSGLSEGRAPFAELRFELKAEATPAQLQSFLVRLAASPRHARVVGLSLVPRRASQKLDVHVTLLALASSDALEDEERSR